MAIWSAEIKELEKLYESFKGQLPELEKELEQLIHFDDPNVILLYSRRCLEVIITDLCECELKRPRKTEPLKGIIDKLHKEEKVPSHIISSMYGLNELSTYGTHPKDFDPEQVKPVLNNLDVIIKWYLKYRDIQIVGIQKSEEKISEKVTVEETKKKEKKKLPKTDLGSKGKPSHSLSSFVPWMIIVIIIALALLFGVRWYNSQQKIKWAQLVQIPAIRKMVDDNFVVPTKAFEMAAELEKIIPGDSNLLNLWKEITTTIFLQTQPSGADVYWKDYYEPDSIWKFLGLSPIQDARIPQGSLLFKIEKQGFQTILYAGDSSSRSSLPNNLKLDSIGKLPEKMVRIPSTRTNMLIVGLEQYGGKEVGEFLIDKYEVTNKEYKIFVDSGGYSNKNYWNYPFYVNGREQPWSEAIKLFVDQTGKPGPSTWEVGTYPDGKENHPVSGVSWYEAAAFAEFMHKKLPSVYQWSVIAQTRRTKDIIPISNFNGNSTLPVGSTENITSFGIYDIAGNIREWCLNNGNKPDQRYILGGGFNDPTYSFNCAYTQLSIDRSVSNGFRCVKKLPGDSTITKLSGRIDLAFRDYRKEKPVDDKTFDIYLKQFVYDNLPLNEKIINIEESDIWKVEKVTIDAAYNKERFNIWLFLPKNTLPPFDPIVYFPGSGVIFTDVFRTTDYEVKFSDYFGKSGRALIYPILKGTFERRDGLKSDLQEKTVFYKEHVIMWRKDIGRTIDYLETRKDMFTDKIGYFGFSWGGVMGGIMPAVESRIKAVVLLVGGMEMHQALPEVDQINFLPRVHQPILMLNGKYDMFFPEETSQKPMFDLLGSKIKELKTYNDGHLVPRQDLIKETLKWYDQYLGVVKK